MKHFKPEEFRGSWEYMNQDLLDMLDEYRETLGFPVVISPHPDALGRTLSPDHPNYGSMHNITKYGACRAADVMPYCPTLEDAYNAAREIGFTGIGLYPDWSPHFGVHLDNRPDRTPEDPALWAARKVWDARKKRFVQVYNSIVDVLDLP